MAMKDEDSFLSPNHLLAMSSLVFFIVMRESASVTATWNS